MHATSFRHPNRGKPCHKHPMAASHPRLRAACTWETCGVRLSLGSPCAPRAARSPCASRTSTHARPPPAPPKRSSTTCAGSASTGTRDPSSKASVRPYTSTTPPVSSAWGSPTRASARAPSCMPRRLLTQATGRPFTQAPAAPSPASKFVSAPACARRRCVCAYPKPQIPQARFSLPTRSTATSSNAWRRNAATSLCVAATACMPTSLPSPSTTRSWASTTWCAAAIFCPRAPDKSTYSVC